MSLLQIPSRRVRLQDRELAPHRAYRYGLVSAWKLDEDAGPRRDAYGTNHLTDNNTVTQAAGVIGSAGLFTAANSEYLSVADNAALSTGDIDFWAVTWAYLNSISADQYIICKYLPAGSQREWYLARDNATGRFSFGVSATGGGLSASQDATTLGVVASATWYFLMVAHDSIANTISISANGGPFDSSAYTLGVFDSTAPFQIGALATPAGYMDGRIDAVAFGKSPPAGISALKNEIRAYFWNGGNGRQYPNGWT